MADVFLSYAKEDRARAKTITALLESCGWSVFWDFNIKATAGWREVLQSELDKAGAVVVLWSHSSIASTWVQDEAERGRSRLVSVRIDDVTLPLGFSSQQAVDLIGWRGGKADGVGKLIDAIAEIGRKPPERPPKIPRSPAQTRLIAAAAAVVLALVAAYAVHRYVTTPKPIMNQEIVIDASDGMSAQFDNGPTKLDAAVQALRTRNLHPAENLALRSFGGTCHQDDESRVLVSFGTNRRQRIVSAATGLRPRGQPTLASAVISALADLQPLSHTKRVVVLTGHADACQEEAIREIKERVEAYRKEGHALNLEMRFIGLAVPAKDRARIREMSEAVGGQSHFVNTVVELNAALEYVLEFEPAVIHVKTVWDVVGNVGKSMNDVANALNSRKFDEAQNILDAGKESYLSLTPSFEALAGPKLSADFARFYKLAAENRTLQTRVFDVGETLIAQGKAMPADVQTPEYRESINAWNELVGKYNANNNEMQRLTNAIVRQVRKSG